MKTALAIVCILLLAWTQPVPGHASAASEARPRACCGCGTSCCSTDNHQPESQPVSAAPVSPSQNLLLTLAPAALVWTLPSSEACEFFLSSFSPLPTPGAPLYARNCVYLI